MPGKGIVLVSGGLDSLLAARLLMEQGIELTGFHCILPFVPPDAEPSRLPAIRMAEQINLPTRTYRCGVDYIEMLRNPPHGYGTHINPCIDCHIYFLKKAAELMKEIQADFVATGEVVGQRPMSQMKHMLNHIEKASGLRGRLLRPLSAGLLKPTIPEMEGIVDRTRLLSIHGRSRTEQFRLAERFGIREYSSPAGGCLFTDRFFAGRVRDLFLYYDNIDMLDLYLCTIGRQYRISTNAKLIVGRNEDENVELMKYREWADYLFTPHFKGPTAVVKGVLDDAGLHCVGSILAFYGRKDPCAKTVTMHRRGMDPVELHLPAEIESSRLDALRI